MQERLDRMGECFGERSLVVRRGADLSRLRAAVERYIEGKTPGRNGNLQGGPGWSGVVVEYWNVVKSHIKGISHCQSSPSVRIKEGAGVGPYETSKLHSDIFAGDPSGVVVMIPLWGDIEFGGVEFFSPTKNFDQFRGYSDYSFAPDFGPEYLGKMEEGYIHFVDAYCLHKTSLGKRRVSLDHRLIFDRFIAGDTKGTRLRNYVHIDNFPCTDTTASCTAI